MAQKKRVNLIGYSVDKDCRFTKGDNWTLNGLMLENNKIERHFYLHDKHSMANYEEIVDWANECDIPIVVRKKSSDIKNNLVYPIKEIAWHFGTDYFTSSLAFMLAMAIYEEYECIHIIGMPYCTDIEYFEQKACVEFWIGMALGQGIDVVIDHPASVFMQQPDGELYGYEKEIGDIK
jgi:hypothetical protein